MKAPRLTTPTFSKRVDSSIETRPKAFKHWLDYLPFATPANAAQQLRKGIATINRQPLPINQRFELLELLHQPLETLTDAYLQPRPDRGTRPLNQRNRQLGDELKLLNTEIAYGYKIITKESLDKGSKSGKRKQLTTALQRTLSYLEQTLLLAFIDYAPFPANVWREIYQIYLFAEDQGLLELTIDDPLNRDAHQTTLSRLFKQIVLLSLIDPYRFPEGQTWLVFNYLKQQDGLGKVVPLAEVDENLGFFLFDLNSDLMPQPLSDEPPPLDEPRMIDARKLVVEINTLRETIQSGGKLNTGLPRQLPINDTLQLLARLQRTWTSKQSRKTPRIEGSGKVTIATGLEAIHHFIDGGVSLLPPLETDDERIEISSKLGGDFASGRQHQFNLNQWRLLNRSLGGISLTAPNKTSNNLSTGQLLATYSEERDAASWTIALIRWLMHDKQQQETRFGIQYLSKHPTTSTIRAQVGSKLEMEAQPALLFEIRTKSGMQKSLVCPEGFFRANRDLLVMQEGKFKPYRCEQLIETTSHIDWFTYSERPTE